MLMMKSMMMTLIIPMALIMMSNTMSFQKISKKQKKIEFECGFNSLSKNRLPFSSQFFLVTIMFLMFDLEITMIMPMATENNKSMNNLISMSMTLTILYLAFLTEWLMGSIEWSK